MAKRKPAARSRRPGRQAASAQPRAKKRTRRASSARPSGAGARKTAARAKAGVRVKATASATKVRRAKAARRQTGPAKPARLVRKNRPTAKMPKAAKAIKPVKPVKLTKAAKPAATGGAATAAAKPRASRKGRLGGTRAPQAGLDRGSAPRIVEAQAGSGPQSRTATGAGRRCRGLPHPPSSLGLDRTASAARSGRQELRDRYDNHNETGPVLTAGDIDANWESAYSTGDEAPGGDNPTPDQNVVDDIGLAVGVAYDDNEELEGADRIEERDRHRWEFDPASSDDFDER
jgi:hypothetical protein